MENILHRLSKSLHNRNNNFKIEERRRKVASLIAQSMTETEIAERLNVDQFPIDCHNSNVVVVGCGSVQLFSLTHHADQDKILRLLLHLAALQELEA